MLHRQFFVYFSFIPLIVSVSYLEILTFFSVIEMYIKMSEISTFWLSVLISQVAPYLMFILVSTSTHPVSLVLSSQNARLCRNCALIRPTIVISSDLYNAIKKILDRISCHRHFEFSRSQDKWECNLNLTYPPFKLIGLRTSGH